MARTQKISVRSRRTVHPVSGGARIVTVDMHNGTQRTMQYDHSARDKHEAAVRERYPEAVSIVRQSETGKSQLWTVELPAA